MEHVSNNIQFVEQVLKSYKKPPQDSENVDDAQEVQEAENGQQEKPKKKVVRVSYEQGKDNQRILKFDFDVETNRLAFPKFRILEATQQTNENLLKNFMSDTRNTDALNVPEQGSKESLGDAPEKIPSAKQRDRKRALNLSENMKRQASVLQKRKEKLLTLIQEHKDRIAAIEVVTSFDCIETEFLVFLFNFRLRVPITRSVSLFNKLMLTKNIRWRTHTSQSPALWQLNDVSWLL